MASANWPEKKTWSYLRDRIDRVDGPVKATGAARYSYDVNRPGMLYAKVLYSQHASAKINGIDLSGAKSMKGVKATWRDEDLIGSEVQYAGQMLAAVAAVTEELAQEAVKQIKVDYEVKKPQVIDDDPEYADDRASRREEGNLEEALKGAEVVSEGEYGLPVVTHCCMESHGQVAEVKDGELHLWPSTQNVSRYADQMGEQVGIPGNKTHVNTQYMGGGFGSKFSHDKWGIVGAILAKQSGRPVKLMLDRDMELMAAGNRPSAYSKVKVGVKKDGTITAMDEEVWGTGGPANYRPPPFPYVFTGVENWRQVGRRIRTNRGGQRAWRAPNHPQGCLITMAAIDDAAAALGMDALDFFRHNTQLTERPDVYREELDVAADMIGYRQKAHPRGDKTPGPVKRGLGISMHQWGGLGHPSECDLTIHPDGSVECKIGTQDLGTGTRTVINIVVAETLGLALEDIEVKIGKSAYPQSGASGGSTTVGGVSASSRLAATSALNALLDVVASELGVSANELEARYGHIRVKGDPTKAVSWKEACSMLGPSPINKKGVNDRAESREKGLIDGGVGGVQMADVSVDTETGIVTINEMVGVQDCGLVIDLKTAESQVYGAMIMGITYSLFEEAVYDRTTGSMLNADMEFYRLAGLQDVGDLRVHMMGGEKYAKRGVIGLGEPPVISPGAAISNAVANACGVRVPYLPLTPERVTDALEKGGMSV